MVAGSRILYKISLSGRSSRLWLSGLGAAALGAIVAVGCAQQPPTDTAASPSPTTTTSPVAAGSPAPFAQPMVAGKPGQPGQVAASPPVPVLDQFIPPTNPNTRATQTQADIAKNKDRRDPFAVPLQVGPVPQLPAGYKPGQGQGAKTPGGTATSPNTTSKMGGMPDINIPNWKPLDTPQGDPPGPAFRGFPPPVIGDPARAVAQNTGLPPFVNIPKWQPVDVPEGDPAGPAFRGFVPPDISDPPRPVVQVAQRPQPVDAQKITVSGVVQTGKDFKIIVQSPGDTARYVTVGDYISNGQVLVKRIDLDSLYDPVVVLEQFGQEVKKSVGEAASTSSN